jgi:hypothetical protein
MSFDFTAGALHILDEPESLLQHPLSTSAFDSALISSYRSVVRPVVAFSDLPLLEINEKSTTIIVQTLSTTAWPQPSLVAPLSASVITVVSLCSLVTSISATQLPYLQ